MRRVALDQVDLEGHDIAKLLIANVAAGGGGGGGTGRGGCCSRMVVTQVSLEGFGALESFWTQRATFGGGRGRRLCRTARHFHHVLLLVEREIHDARLLVLLHQLAVGQHFVVGESDSVFCEEDVAAQVENGR